MAVLFYQPACNRQKFAYMCGTITDGYTINAEFCSPSSVGDCRQKAHETTYEH